MSEDRAPYNARPVSLQGRGGSKLLINEPPLVILPSLATAIGLEESIIVQQVHYWLLTSSHEHDGRKWVYNTVEAWAEQFPFWSSRTVKRTLARLRDSGLLLAGVFNASPWDRTLWYTIDYEALSALTENVQLIVPTCPNATGQAVPIQSDRLAPPIPETTQETTSESSISTAPPKSEPLAPQLHDPDFALVIDKLASVGVMLSSPYEADKYADLLAAVGLRPLLDGITAAAENGAQSSFKYTAACSKSAWEKQQRAKLPQKGTSDVRSTRPTESRERGELPPGFVDARALARQELARRSAVAAG